MGALAGPVPGPGSCRVSPATLQWGHHPRLARAAASYHRQGTTHGCSFLLQTALWVALGTARVRTALSTVGHRAGTCRYQGPAEGALGAPCHRRGLSGLLIGVSTPRARGGPTRRDAHPQPLACVPAAHAVPRPATHATAWAPRLLSRPRAPWSSASGRRARTPTLFMCSCCWKCCLCFSRNCWCCCWITRCCRAGAFWGSGADWVRPSGRCCRSLCMDGDTRSAPTRGCACRGSAPRPERQRAEGNTGADGGGRAVGDPESCRAPAPPHSPGRPPSRAGSLSCEHGLRGAGPPCAGGSPDTQAPASSGHFRVMCSEPPPTHRGPHVTPRRPGP